MKKIRLLIIDESLGIGGKEFLIHQHLKHLSKRCFEIHLMTFYDEGSVLHLCMPLIDHYCCLHRRFKFDVPAILKLRRYLINYRIDIAHSNNWLTSLYLKIASSGLSIVKISTFHGYDRTWRNCIHLKVLQTFDNVICVSKALRIDLFRMGLPWIKLVVVANCYDPERFHLSQTPQLKTRDTTFRMLMVSSFRWQKDQLTLIETARILTEQGFNIELHFVGGGDPEYINKIRELTCQYHIDNAVIFHGEKIIDSEFLSKFSLFAFSSFSESFGIAPLEAMASGLPVLVSDIPSLMELIQYGRSGAFFETGNYTDCVNKIKKLIQNQDVQKKLIGAGIERAKNYRPEKVVEDLDHLYQQLYSCKK